MKRIYNNMRGVMTAATLLFAVACHSDKSPVVVDLNSRTIEVCTSATRTTIAYEGSDVSHLEWCAGDKVAYVTDVVGDTFKSAEMKDGASGWSFTADIPADAKNIYVIYPVGANEGKTLVEAQASLAAAYTQVMGGEFDGSQLPMMAQSAVPDGSRVDVVYECMASVVRFTITAGEGHETEVLRSLTLSANESLAGDYTLDVATSTMRFADEGANTIRVECQSGSETGEDISLANEHTIYVVVPSAEYTGVDVVVETDAESYYWTNGSMSLTHPERRLYRISLDLDTAEGAPVPEVPHFKPMLSLSEVTDDGVYLIAVNIDGKYYVTNNTPTDTSNYYWVEGVEVPSDEIGVIHNADVMNYTWSITKRDGGYEFYSSNMLKQGEYGVVLISQGGTGMFSNEDGYEGKAWFVTMDTVDGYSETQQPRRYWDIELDGTGNAVMRNKYDRGVNMFPCYKYCTSHNYFTLCFEGGGEEKADIQILKLNQ